MRTRIISGDLKGRLITVPDSKLIRPTTDRVRETLFNLLNNRLDFNGISVLDIYAGSGALGIECISRGAACIHFVEKNFVIYKNLQQNLDTLGISEKCKIYKMEAVKYSQSVKSNKYDLILADPPFFKDDIYKVVLNLALYKFLAEEGIMIIERSIQTKEKDLLNFGVEPFKIIGDACLYQLQLNNSVV